jgi:hypothetical protein
MGGEGSFSGPDLAGNALPEPLTLAFVGSGSNNTGRYFRRWCGWRTVRVVIVKLDHVMCPCRRKSASGSVDLEQDALEDGVRGSASKPPLLKSMLLTMSQQCLTKAARHATMRPPSRREAK